MEHRGLFHLLRCQKFGAFWAAHEFWTIPDVSRLSKTMSVSVAQNLGVFGNKIPTSTIPENNHPRDESRFFFFCTFVLFFADLSGLPWDEVIIGFWSQFTGFNWIPTWNPYCWCTKSCTNFWIAKEILSKEPDIQMDFFGYQLVFPRILSSSSPRCPHTESPRSSCSCLFRLSRNLAGIPPSKPSNLHWEAWKLQKMMRFTWGNHQLGVFCFFLVIFSWILPWDSSPLNHYLGELFLELFPGIEQANPSFARATTPVFFLLGIGCPKTSLVGYELWKGGWFDFLSASDEQQVPTGQKKAGVVSMITESPAFIVGDVWIRSLNKSKWLVEFYFHKGIMSLSSLFPKKVNDII